MTETLDYREIPLTRGLVALVDAADYEYLSQWKWCAWKSAKLGIFYAVRSGRNRDGGSSTILMHREILGLKKGDKLRADHRNPLLTMDNRRSNLRIATVGQNNRNCQIHRTNKSGFKGVSPVTRSATWQASIRVDGKKIGLGSFATPELAHEAYKKAAVLYHGEFARFS